MSKKTPPTYVSLEITPQFRRLVLSPPNTIFEVVTSKYMTGYVISWLWISSRYSQLFSRQEMVDLFENLDKPVYLKGRAIRNNSHDVVFFDPEGTNTILTLDQTVKDAIHRLLHDPS